MMGMYQNCWSDITDDIADIVNRLSEIKNKPYRYIQYSTFLWMNIGVNNKV